MLDSFCFVIAVAVVVVVDRHYRDHHDCHHWIHGHDRNHHARRRAERWIIVRVRDKWCLRIQVEQIQHQLHLACHIQYDGIVLDSGQMERMDERCRLEQHTDEWPLNHSRHSDQSYLVLLSWFLPVGLVVWVWQARSQVADSNIHVRNWYLHCSSTNSSDAKRIVLWPNYATWATATEASIENVSFVSRSTTDLKCFDHMNVWHWNNRVFFKTEIFLSNHNTFLHQILVDECAMFLGHQHFSGPCLNLFPKMKSHEI